MFKGKTRHGVDIRSTVAMPVKPDTRKWVVVMDRSNARVFARTNGSGYFLHQEIPFPAGRLHPREMLADKPGRSFDSAARGKNGGQGGSRHSYSGSTEIQDQMNQKIARRISRLLDNAKEENRYADLILVAEAQLLGTVRKFLSPQVKRSITQEHELDLAWLSGTELKARVAQL